MKVIERIAAIAPQNPHKFQMAGDAVEEIPTESES